MFCSAIRVCGIDVCSKHLDLDYLQSGNGQRRSQRLPDTRAGQQKLLKLCRQQEISLAVMESNRRKQETLPAMGKSIDAVIAFLDKQIQRIDKQLSELLRQDQVLEETVQIIDAIPGFARTSAIALVCAMPELGRLNRQQAGALAGLACYDQDSGPNKGVRRIRGGRKRVRRALFMPALTAISRFEPTRAMYQRLPARPGHPRMQAVTACMRKLLVIINARVKEMLSRTAVAKVASCSTD